MQIMFDMLRQLDHLRQLSKMMRSMIMRSIVHGKRSKSSVIKIEASYLM